MYESFAYILNRRPFRDSSLLLDIFTQDYGRICCVARPAKKRGKILKGHTEPFRYLHLQWIGKGDVQTLVEADERGRHMIPASELMIGLYINELVLLFTQQHLPQNELFNAYKYTLQKIGDTQINRQILMRFELYLLQNLGFSLEIEANCVMDQSGSHYFSTEEGLVKQQHGVNAEVNNKYKYYTIINNELLLALQDIPNMQESHWLELRVFLDKVFLNLAPRPINSRKLITL